MAHILLIVLFLLTIGHLLSLKLCSNRLDHRTAPVFISLWVLMGLAATYPVFGHLLGEGWAKMAASPYLIALCVAKGVFLYVLFVISQELMKASLSSRHYVTPMAVGITSLINAQLGERLTAVQWTAALGLCAIATAFFLKGHLSELTRQQKISYIKLVILGAVLPSFDQHLIKYTNWYVVLVISNIVLLTLAVALNHRSPQMLKSALFNKYALLAGLFYMMTELTKFYQQETINPVTVVITVQAATKPVILTLSALLWKERTVREQLIWGLMAFMIALPLFF